MVCSINLHRTSMPLHLTPKQNNNNLIKVHLSLVKPQILVPVTSTTLATVISTNQGYNNAKINVIETIEYWYIEEAVILKKYKVVDILHDADMRNYAKKMFTGNAKVQRTTHKSHTQLHIHTIYFVLFTKLQNETGINQACKVNACVCVSRHFIKKTSFELKYHSLNNDKHK